LKKKNSKDRSPKIIQDLLIEVVNEEENKGTGILECKVYSVEYTVRRGINNKVGSMDIKIPPDAIEPNDRIIATVNFFAHNYFENNPLKQARLIK
jgi:hypothetical protein